MKEFVNHLLYGIHMWTQILNPTPYYDPKERASRITIAYDAFIFMHLNFMIAIPLPFIRLMGRQIAAIFFKEYFTYYIWFIVLIAAILQHIWFKNNVDEYLTKYSSMPDSAHTTWKWLALLLFVLSIVFMWHTLYHVSIRTI